MSNNKKKKKKKKPKNPKTQKPLPQERERRRSALTARAELNQQAFKILAARLGSNPKKVSAPKVIFVKEGEDEVVKSTLHHVLPRLVGQKGVREPTYRSIGIKVLLDVDTVPGTKHQIRGSNPMQYV
jgi:hypothetical protein